MRLEQVHRDFVLRPHRQHHFRLYGTGHFGRPCRGGGGDDGSLHIGHSRREFAVFIGQNQFDQLLPTALPIGGRFNGLAIVE